MLNISYFHPNKKVHTKQFVRGFTLMETLVSVFIITTTILGPLTVAISASSYARQTKDTMTAIYLAQEAVELLHHQQDSIYLSCVWQTGSNCVPVGGETLSEAAWRIFSDRLNSNVQGPSCYSPNECAYDFIDMSNDVDYPSKYASTDTLCSTLSTSNTDNYYVCSGAHGSTPGYTISPFSRSVTVVSIPTFEDKGDDNYNNDLRVTATVSFKRVNGYTRQIKVVEFFHSRA